MTAAAREDRRFIALDIDGTILLEDGTLTDEVLRAVHRVRDLGHEVTLATGRSVAMTLPVLDRLGITPEFVICCNGAITLDRDPDAPVGYRRIHVETFIPREVLTTIRRSLEHGAFAVEDETGIYRYSGTFPDGSLGGAAEHVDFDELLDRPATRVVVLSPTHGTEEFLEIVERMGLHKVSYNVGWTAWLDIAPDGVNKSTAAERARAELGIPREHVVAVGDGRNDLEFLTWAGAGGGRGVAMGQAPRDVRVVASEITGADVDDGLATVLDSID
jgi:Cof subfamily protein (haloacid dehalogenase superfamily)